MVVLRYGVGTRDTDLDAARSLRPVRVAAAAVAAAYLIALGATLFDVSGLLAVAAAAGSRCSWPASPWSWSCARGLSPEQLWAWLAERPRVSAVPTR